MQDIKAKLAINSFRFKIHLGVTEEEKSVPQDVELSLEIFFDKLPLACLSDKLEETTCYGDICNKVLLFCEERKFNLIENLTYLIYKLLKEQLAHKIKITIKKCNPPVENLIGGASFTITD